ncbi:T9SS sorting signal type C domain-containing protein [Flavobacterium fluviale]|uniref:SUEL-type lectin domain-containing protein n=1 Tax=Flavobacterium fluviale TaxID=2249356 RepID=A0A344LPA7_9FLAO|nr:T9SS sorting signal type C domain-containing protein [Flavobacterium fluviale]AXB55749.1 hypothetical protein HYN86_03690 [Flavobacterium fluviale]
MMRKLLYSFLLFILSKFSSKRSFTPNLGLLCIGTFIVFSNSISGQILQRGNVTSGTVQGSTMLTIDRPNNVVAGDVMIVNISQVGTGNNTNTLSNPNSSGWNLIRGQRLGTSGRDRWGAILYKVATNSEPSSYTFSVSSTIDGAIGSIVAFSGVDVSGNTPEVISTSINVTTTNTPTASGITTVSPNSSVIMFIQVANSAPDLSSGWQTATSPGALTQLYYNKKDTGGDVSVGAAWARKDANGATGSGTVSMNSNQTSGAVLVALKPLTYKSQIISISSGPTTWCPGETRNVDVTIRNTGTATWTDGASGSPDINIGVKWNTNGTSWTDYHSRVDAGSLAPGATQTYTLPITASNNNGTGYSTAFVGGTTNRLTFDVVYEGPFWFASNQNGAGPGNAVSTSSVQTILASPANKTIAVASSPICSGNSTNITVSSSEIGVSYQLRNGTTAVGAPVSGTGGNINLPTGNLTATTTFNVLASSCGNSTQMTGTATVSINPLPTASNAGADQNGNGVFTLAANTPSAGTGAWTIVSGPSTSLSQFNNTSSATATFTPFGTGSYTLRWTVTNSCGTSTDDVVLVANCVTNLIKNGDFKNGSADWSTATARGSYTEVLTEGVYFSNGSNDNTAELDSQASLRQQVTVVPGVSYTLNFLYARRPGSPASVAVDARILGGAATPSINYTTSNNNSTPFLGTLTFVPTTSTIYVEFYNSLGSTTLGSIIDNIVLIPSAQVTPIATTSPKGTFKTLTACAGVPVQLDVENVPTSGVTYAWTSTSPGAVFSSTNIKNPMITFAATATGTQEVTVIVTSSGGCAGAPSSTYVNLLAAPTIYNVTGGGSYCSGGIGVAVGLANSTSGVSYQLKLDGIDVSGAVVSGTGAAITFGNRTASGTYTVVATNPSPNSCALNMSGSAVIVVNPTSVGGNIAGGATVCTGLNTTTLTLSGHTGLVTKWQSSPSSTFASSITDISNTTTTLIATNLTATTYYRAVVASGACIAANSTVATITVNQVHTITAGANRSVCQNNAMTNITMTLGGGATGATVTGLPSGVTSSVASGVLTISGTPTVSGQFTYNVTTTGNSCTVATTSGTITIGVGNNTISYTNGTSGTVCAFADENNPINFIAPAGNYFNTVNFASYGRPDGSCGSYTIQSCHSSTSQSKTEELLLGTNTTSFLADNTNYGDPCFNVFKRFYGSASYTQPICQGTTAPIISGNTPTGNGTYTYSWESSTTGVEGSFSTISGANSQDYSPGILNQSTFFRRTVTSNGCSSTSTMVLVKVNPRPTSVVSGTTSICNGTSATVSVALTGTAPWSLTYSDGTNTTNVSGITASPYTFNVSPTANTTYTVTALNDANNCPSIPADRTGNAVISINPRPTAAVSGSTTICSGESTTISVAFTGTAPWNISYTYGATSGSFSTSLNPYTVSVNPTSTTTYAITALSDANCTAVAAGITGNATITVNPLPTTPTVAKTDITCETSGGVSITNLPSGNWTINQTGTALQTISGTGSSHSIANLAAGTYYFTVTNASNCTSSPAVSATIVDQISTTIWNGSSWSNGDPDSSKRVIVNSAANQPFTINIAACSLTINVPTGAGDPDVIIPNGVTLTITNSVTSNGKLVFESGSSLIQTTNAVNSGDIVYKRTTSVRRYDLTYWSMPVTKSGFTMHDLSPGTLFDKFHYYDSNAGKWGISNNGTMVMETGKGYTIRAPQSYHLIIPQDFTAVFTGVPNNGDISVPVVNTKWNLIGNPYPSAISAQQLMADNPNLGSLYFWGHEELPVRNPADNTYYYNNDYTIFNASGATTGGGGVPFNGYIAATQGFFAKPETGTIVFKNNERRAGNNSQFYKTAAAESIERNRVWLNITSSSGVFKQILFGYIQGATNSLDINYDAVSMAANSLVDFYSINTNKKLTIQGRALPFEKSDEVPLGYKLSAKGDYTISIDHADGIFNNQDVYLVDKETGKTTNLRLENYTFTTAEGSFNNRFVIRYTSKTLGTDDFENLENSVVVSVKDGVVKITSSKELLKEVNIFNVGAQLLYNKNKVNSSELIISNLHSSDQALLVKITLENGHTFTKKIIYSNL